MKPLQITVINDNDDSTAYYLPLFEEKDGHWPFRLGTGRNAVVFLGWTKDQEENSRFLAFKFLKNDPNEEYAQMVSERFLIEMKATEKITIHGNYFVQFRGRGFIGKLDKDDKKNPKWKPLYDKVFEKNATDAFQKIKDHFKLQGPFYLMELCQGTLHDLLERPEPWIIGSRAYQVNALNRNALLSENERTSEIIKDFKSKYIDTSKLKEADDFSGYDILNAFKTDEASNNVRNYAVMEIFKGIARTVGSLHKNNLVHRDLKLGNLFFWHPYDDGINFDNIIFKLADLGYAADIRLFQKADWTLEVDNWRTPGALVPGSQYYRAPEQARLPIEVRANIAHDNPKQVIIKSSKVTEIEKGDQLVIGDFFGIEEDEDSPQNNNVRRIESVNNEGSVYTIELEYPLDLISKDDLEAHIIKSTGYHTDGFSLGAILYDLASGGKNPEDFYTYNLASYHKITHSKSADLENSPKQISVKGIVDSFYTEKHLKNLFDSRIVEKLIKSTDSSESNDENQRKFINSIQQFLWPGTDTPSSQQKPSSKRNETKDDFFKIIEAIIDKPLSADLLTDVRGVRIPEEILTIIVKCMVRDFDDTYYKTSAKGYFTDENKLAISDHLVIEVENYLTQLTKKLKIEDKIKNNLLIILRMFWHPETLSNNEGNSSSSSGSNYFESQNLNAENEKSNSDSSISNEVNPEKTEENDDANLD